MQTTHDLSLAYRGRTVAITGSRGYIGSVLTSALSQAGAHLLLVSRRPIAPQANAEVVTADLREKACWQDIARRADVVFHLAGNTSVYAAAADPAESFRSTALPPAHLVAAARDARRMLRIVYASTATVYGLTDRLPVGEETTPTPVTIYDLHKWFAEQQLMLASRQGLLEAVSLRLSNVYGPSPGASASDDRGVLNRVARLALAGCDVPVYGGGRFLRDYVYIDDVVRAFLMAGTQPGIAGHTFNVGSGVGIPVRDAFRLAADRAERRTGRRCELYDAEWPDDVDRIESRNFTADIRRMASACGWGPAISLTDGVTRLVDHVYQGGARMPPGLP